MPEGDTIHRTAARLRAALAGRPVTRFAAPRLTPPFPAAGTTVTDVEPRGKHLLIRFADGLVLHTHLRMTGSWTLHRDGDRHAGGRGVRALVGVPGAVAICSHAPVVELLDEAAVARHPALRALGPDLCLAAVDLDAALARMRALPEPDAPIADVLLDQRVAAGIGNVYKSEVCFLHGVHPRQPLWQVDDATRRALLETASRLLRRNLTTVRRTTVAGAPDGSLWVYGREGRPCRRCGTPIAGARLGAAARRTAWCPRCQPMGTAAT